MTNKEFTKNNSLALKGIAIMMMLAHHLFRLKDLFIKYNVSFYPFNSDLIVKVAENFKICVSIFAFISGYGLYLSYDKLIKNKINKDNVRTIKQEKELNSLKVKETVKWIVDRLIKLLSGFWIIALLSYILLQVINGYTISTFFKDGMINGIFNISINFFGLSSLFKTPCFNNPWWYMTLAIIIVLLVPIIYSLGKKYNYYTIFIAYIIIPRIIGVNNEYTSFIFPMILGMFCADKNIIPRVSSIKLVKNSILNFLIYIITIPVIIYTLYKVYQALPINTFYELHYGLIPVILICLLYKFILNIKYLDRVLEFLGKHSMNMYLIHDFLLMPFIKDYIYSFKHFTIIFLVLLFISLFLSIVVELIKKVIKYNEKINRVDNYFLKRIDENYTI